MGSEEWLCVTGVVIYPYTHRHLCQHRSNLLFFVYPTVHTTLNVVQSKQIASNEIKWAIACCYLSIIAHSKNVDVTQTSSIQRILQLLRKVIIMFETWTIVHIRSFRVNPQLVCFPRGASSTFFLIPCDTCSQNLDYDYNPRIMIYNVISSLK